VLGLERLCDGASVTLREGLVGASVKGDRTMARRLGYRTRARDITMASEPSGCLLRAVPGG
jgi:hypothetical protein